MTSLTFTVHDHPAPQGSKRGYYNQHLRRVQMVESSAKVKPWREAVKHAALAALDTTPDWDGNTGPLIITVTFALPRPKGHYRTGRNAHLLRDGAPLAPAGKPDLDKLLRSTFDALTAAGVWHDDSQVTTVAAAKVYAGPDGQLAVPGALISVEPLIDAVDRAIDQALAGGAA